MVAAVVAEDLLVDLEREMLGTRRLDLGLWQAPAQFCYALATVLRVGRSV